MKVQVSLKKSQRRWERLKRLQTPSPVPALGPDILSLPQDVLLVMFKGLHIKDLLNLRSSHPSFRGLVDTNSSLWASATFRDLWPSGPNMKHFTRSAENGNLEALIKLGVAYLYNEGLCQDFRNRRYTNFGEYAANLFSLVERLTPDLIPFTWLFIRPPWTTHGTCCKKWCYESMLNIATVRNETKLHVCMAMIYQLLDESEPNPTSRLEKHLLLASNNSYAQFLHWKISCKDMLEDTAKTLQGVRQLRNIAGSGQKDAVLELCRLYARGYYGGTTKQQAAVHVAKFMQSSVVTNIQVIGNGCKAVYSVRYILIDWLVDLTYMKHFRSSTLHCAISVVDRFLKVHLTPRNKLQLLGVAAMVLCSRLLGTDILTIREAAWMTDNTYNYGDVVRMMGEITATLRGNIKTLTSYDYVLLTGELVCNDSETQCLSEYIIELTLLHCELGIYAQAQMAAAAVLLARLTKVQEFPWPSHMKDFTGYNIKDIAKCALHIHRKCFQEKPLVDNRQMVLQAISNRYSTAERHCVSAVKIVSYEELQTLLGFGEETGGETQKQLYFSNIIQSPSRNPNKAESRMSELSSDREQAATPTLDKRDLNWNQLNESGYEGDKEDEDESFMEQDCDVDPNLKSPWNLDLPHDSSEAAPSQNQVQNSSSGQSKFNLNSPTGEANSALAADSSPTNFLSPSIRINLPNYAAFSSTPNVFSPSWQKVASSNGEQSFSFSFDVDNFGVKASDGDGARLARSSSIEKKSLSLGHLDSLDNATPQPSGSKILIHPSADKENDISHRCSQSIHSVKGGCPTVPVTSVLQSAVTLSSSTPNPCNKRPVRLVPLESFTKSMPNRRTALATVTNTRANTPAATITNSNGKRKSGQELGNNNKTRIISELFERS